MQIANGFTEEASVVAALRKDLLAVSVVKERAVVEIERNHAAGTQAASFDER